MKHEGHGHEEGNKRWAAEEWEGAPADRRDADTGVPGVESPRWGSRRGRVRCRVEL